MKHIFTISLCFLALSLSAQEDDCLLINEEINDFVVMGTFDSHQYYISENPVPISDGFYEVYNDLASLYSGNLLTIGSMEEDEYVYSTFFNGGFSNLSSYYYIGLYNTDPSNLCCGQGNPPGVWEWINGESVEYTNWDINANQPSGDELYASGGGSWGGVWADVSGGHQGYIIIEVEQCPVSVSGCLDSYACNFNDSATEDDGSCDYSCCPGPGCCNIGMTWNWELGICETSIPTDTNLDGCTNLTDLMDILSAYGECAVAEFTCGDPLEYQGYNYETVQIGGQCWFAENLRAENYRNGDAILYCANDCPWQHTTTGASSVYGDTYSNCGVNLGSGYCSLPTAEVFDVFGRLYNWHAVTDEREVCPSGWSVPSVIDFENLISSSQLQGTSYADYMKSSDTWIESTVDSGILGFQALAGGYGGNLGGFDGDGYLADFWSNIPTNNTNAHHLQIELGMDEVFINNNHKQYALSVRCIKD